MIDKQERKLELQTLQRYREIRTIVIAAFAVWMLPDFGRDIPTIGRTMLLVSAALAGVSWVAVLLMLAPVSVRLERLGDYHDSSDELRAQEYGLSIQFRYQRLSIIASCSSVITTILAMAATLFFWF